jgi:nitrite reductase/ring-hydroxylating ferredoxin subunit
MAWLDAAPRARLSAGRMVEAEAGGRALLIYDIDGQVFATDAICPHHFAWLSQGQISGTAIDCPRHQGQFDIATGRKLRGPDCPDLRTYPARVVGERIEVLIES